MNVWTRLLFTATLMAWALVAMGCGATSDFMRPVQSPSLAAPPAGKALVWVVRPSSQARSITFELMDEKGQFVGDSLAGSRVAGLVGPGEHMFIVWSAAQEAMEANFAVGKT